MVSLYLLKIHSTNFEFNIENVAGLWKAKVLIELAKEGVDGYGNPLEEEEI